MSAATVTDLDVEIRDYLVPLKDAERARRYRARKRASKTPKGCTHPLLKQFTFTDGQTIKMCPDCTLFDNKRWKTIGTTSPNHSVKQSHRPDYSVHFYYTTDHTSGKVVKVDVSGEWVIVSVVSRPSKHHDFYVKLIERLVGDDRSPIERMVDHADDWSPSKKKTRNIRPCAKLHSARWMHTPKLGRFCNFCPDCNTYVKQLHECVVVKQAVAKKVVVYALPPIRKAARSFDSFCYSEGSKSVPVIGHGGNYSHNPSEGWKEGDLYEPWVSPWVSLI